MQPLVELRRMLVGGRTASGRVIAVTNGVLRVATATGVMEIPAVAGIGVGDVVKIDGNRTAKIKNSPDAPVYLV